MRGLTLALLASASVLTSGCVAKTLVDVATLPVRAGAKAVDLATTSQSEADEKRGREIRKREERLGQLERQFAKLQRKCTEGDRRACDEATTVNAEMRLLMPQVPVEPDRR